MSEDDAFLQAILDEPDDDWPRLIYADWLEERGDPRGEFIHLQCALARRQLVPSGEQMAARLRSLLTQHEAAWVKPLRPGVDRWVFRRGFVEEVSVDAWTLLDHADAVFRLGPLRRVQVRGAGPCIPQLAACPYLNRVIVLDLSQNGVDNRGMRALAASPHLTRLAELDLGGNLFDDEGVQALACASFLPQLTALKLNGGLNRDTKRRFGDAGLVALVEKPHLTQLAALDLRCQAIGDLGVQLLASSPHFPCLKKLQLNGNYLTDAGIQALAASPYVAQLTYLNLSGNHMRDEGAEALVAAVSLDRLVFLDVSVNLVSSTGKMALLKRFGKRVRFH